MPYKKERVLRVIPSNGIAILADDLTGAADAAVHFIHEDLDFLMVNMGYEAYCKITTGPQGLALTTESRDLIPREVVRRIRRAADILSIRPYGLIYKKVDSLLRGLPGLEIETLRRCLGRRCSFIAPGNPVQGSITRNAMHFMNGAPFDESEQTIKAASKMEQTCLPGLIASQAGAMTRHIYLNELDQGMDALCNRIETLLADGVHALTFDSTSDGHLRLIARAGLAIFPDALLAGSAGLALALAEELGIVQRKGSIPLLRCRSLLFICGSAAGILNRQASKLVSYRCCREVVIQSRHLICYRCLKELGQDALSAWLSGEDILLRFSEEPLGDVIGRSGMLDKISELAIRLIAGKKPDGIFFSGGATASAVLNRAHARAVRLKALANSGMVWGHVVKGKLDGSVVITKPGAFGQEDDLVNLYHIWKKEGIRDG